MKLRHEIKKFQRQFVAGISDEQLGTILLAAERLAESGIAGNCLQAGDRAPEFVLPNATGRLVSSRELLRHGPLVVSFYRGGWCPYCSLELRALEDTLDEIQQAGAQLVAVSPEHPDSALDTQEKNSLTFEVLSDAGNRVARQFGLVYELDRELRPLYQDFGIDIPARNRDQSYELPIPATYVIDTDGAIAHAFVDTDYTARLEPAEIVEALERLHINAVPRFQMA